jgi:hypothetical protein
MDVRVITVHDGNRKEEEYLEDLIKRGFKILSTAGFGGWNEAIHSYSTVPEEDRPITIGTSPQPAGVQYVLIDNFIEGCCL